MKRKILIALVTIVSVIVVTDIYLFTADVNSCTAGTGIHLIAIYVAAFPIILLKGCFPAILPDWVVLLVLNILAICVYMAIFVGILFTIRLFRIKEDSNKGAVVPGAFD